MLSKPSCLLLMPV